jgi:hypothetical protein
MSREYLRGGVELGHAAVGVAGGPYWGGEGMGQQSSGAELVGRHDMRLERRAGRGGTLLSSGADPR